MKVTIILAETKIAHLRGLAILFAENIATAEMVLRETTREHVFQNQVAKRVSRV